MVRAGIVVACFLVALILLLGPAGDYTAGRADARPPPTTPPAAAGRAVDDHGPGGQRHHGAERRDRPTRTTSSVLGWDVLTPRDTTPAPTAATRRAVTIRLLPPRAAGRRPAGGRRARASRQPRAACDAGGAARRSRLGRDRRHRDPRHRPREQADGPSYAVGTPGALERDAQHVARHRAELGERPVAVRAAAEVDLGDRGRAAACARRRSAGRSPRRSRARCRGARIVARRAAVSPASGWRTPVELGEQQREDRAGRRAG